MTAPAEDPRGGEWEIGDWFTVTGAAISQEMGAEDVARRTGSHPPAAGRGDTDSGGEALDARFIAAVERGMPTALAAEAVYEHRLAPPEEWTADVVTCQRCASAGDRTQPTQELREAIAIAIFRNGAGNYGEDAADAVLALPAVAALLDAQAAVSRARELHSPLDRGTGPHCQGCATHATFTPWPCKTIHALDGTTT